MEARAVARHQRMTPRKVRQVVDLIRGKDVAEARAILRFAPKRGGRLVEKVLQSAVANATHNYDMAEDALYVAEAYVDDGTRMRRLRPRARGRADIWARRLSHVTIVVREREEV